MKHICYFYILDFRSIHNLGISLDARYTYVMHEKTKTLTVRSNPDYVDGMWPEGISSLAALIGSNGAGKTTFLECMLQMLAEGSGEKHPQVIVVYENSALRAYRPKGCDYGIKGDGVDIHIDNNSRPTTELFYYSAYFRPYTSLHIPGDGELAGVYNATDTWKIVNDLLTYSNIDTIIGTETLTTHLNALVARDNNRIAQMLADEKLRKVLPHNVLPRYIKIRPNYSGFYYLQHESRTMAMLREQSSKETSETKEKQSIISRYKQEIYRELDLWMPNFNAYIQGEWLQLISAYFYNCAANLKEPQEMLRLHREWGESLQNNSDALESLEKFLREHRDIRHEFTPIVNALHFLQADCKYNPESHSIFIDTKEENSGQKIKELLHHYSSQRFVVAQTFDMAYSRDISEVTQFSSGELDMLKFFSRLHDATFLRPDKFGNIRVPQLILIDEAENAYHPEWQLMFVNKLLTFLSAIYEKNDRKPQFQVVLTTHSPILLSDLPRMCVNYLEKNSDTGEVKLSLDQPETFGSNVFMLYRNAFFMRKGLIGEFAQGMIAQIESQIKNQSVPTETIMKEINLLGDEAIKEYMTSLLEKYRKRDMLDYYQQKIKELGGAIYAAD